MRRSEAQAVSVDGRGFVIVDGVKIGRRVVRDGAVKIQLCDKDRRRSAERGTRLVEVSVEELGEALEAPASLDTPPPVVTKDAELVLGDPRGGDPRGGDGEG